MMRRFLYFVLLVAGTIGLLACDQAEPSGITAAGIKAERVAQPSVPITVTTPATAKVNGIRPTVTTPATKAPTLGLTNWAETYEPSETEEFVVNEHTLGNQKAPAIACNRAVQNWFYGSATGYEARGACVVAWESYGEAGAGALHDIYARRLINVEYTLDANAARDIYDTAAWHVNDGTGHATGEQLNPAVAVTPDNDEGGYVIVWESNNMDPDNSGYGVFGQRYDKDDAKVDAAFLINTTVADDQLNADVAMDDNGNFVVVWQSLNETGEINTGIYGRAYDSSGSPTAQFHVNEWTTGTQDHPAVTMDDTGNVVVAWHSSQLNAGKDVYARAFKFTAATKTLSDWTSEFLVNTTTADNQQFADLGIADDGTIVVTWEGKAGTSGYDAYYQHLEVAAGPALAKKAGQTETVVNAYTTGDQRKPQIIVDPNGKYVVAYQSEDGQDGDDAGVYYQRFASDGTAHFDSGSQASLVNTEKTVNIQERPAIALLRMESEQYAAETLENAPSFIIAYHSKGQTPQDGAAGDFGIFARRFSVDHDGDGRGLDGDNCKYVAHTYQADANVDQGDVDQDLMGDSCDNCASDTACEKVAKDEAIANFCTITGTDTINYDQTDTDGDTIGDVCDTCPDGVNSTAWVDYATSVNDDTTQVDYDSDGIGDFCDTDDDADNVPDIHEDGNNGNDNPDGDTDGGTAAWISRHDTDSDGDAILDFTEYDMLAAACDPGINTAGAKLPATAAAADHDCDGDTLLNNYDVDSDNDDIPDAFEFDADVEGMELGDAPLNTDGDAYGDWVDSDSNNDNILDYRKVHDANDVLIGYAAKGVATWDWDDDTFSDHIDPDMDGDGVTDTDENGGVDSDCVYPIGQEDAYRNRDNSDLVADCASYGDNDGDGTDGDNDDWLWNWQDLDSDGDGVLDSVEKIDDGIDGDGHCAEVDYDSDGDGILDDHESGSDMPAGIDDDIDDDLAVNSLDTDADGDGVMDAIEWANGCGDGADSPLYPHDDMVVSPAVDEHDCDGDGKENWYDDDSDADGISDAHEAGNEMPAGMDGGAGSICGGNTGTINWMAGLPLPTAFLSSTFQDCDDDGFVNSQDYDADADGVNDLVETSANIEAPVDDAENWFDGDSDGDTMTDAHESGVDRDPCVDLSASYKGLPPFAADMRYRLAICDTPPTPNLIPQDIDEDGDVNSQDFDADNDGVLDYAENNTPNGDDIDGDGVENWWDLDSDADWITDLHESGLEATAGTPTTTNDATGRYPYVQHDIEASFTNGDFDGDGKLNCHDFDSDGDGVADITEWKNNEANSHNLDQDDYENWADDDSDGDGISDAHESGNERPATLDDGAPSLCTGNAAFADSTPIAALATTVTEFFMTQKFQDCDNDNLISSLDTDADADGVLDNLEWQTDAEAELGELECDVLIPNYLNQNDCDGDTFENWYDGDSDGDGMTDAHESGNNMDPDLTLAHCQGLTFNDTYQLATSTDCDGDGYLNTQDSDSDGDGILDVEEGDTYTELTNGCAKVPADDSLEPWFDGDTDGDGILDKVETDNDLDGDGTNNYKDCDSDADTIADWHELDDNSDNDSDMNFLDEDSDNDGIPDQWECDQAVVDGEGACDPVAGDFSWTPNDTDGDSVADYRDIDSDDDGILDAHENGETIPDTITDVYCQGIVQVVNAGVATRHDCDGDGIHNYRDEDSDNDGVGDVVEWANEELVNEDATKSIERDQDGDGLEGWFDMDSDGDGIADVTEKLEVQPAGTVTLIAQLDSDTDGIVNSFDLDSDADYISDEHQCAMGQACECTAGPCVLTHKAPDPDLGADIDTPWDTDGDGTSDYLDNDSDADGVDDLVEAGDTSITTAPLNTDGDNWDDYLDTEADGDGWLDDVDNCPTIYNEDQDDLDEDGVGDACDQDFHECLEVAEDATFTITSPTDYTPGLTAGDADTKAIDFVFEYTGQNAKGLYVYIDDSLYALYKPVPASPLPVDVPFGQHRIAFELSDSNGTPFNGCIDARDAVKLRVSKNCVLLEDCSDGNICSNETCSNGTCSFGDDPTHPQCCNSDYDCAYNDMCLNKLGDTVKECIQCDYDNVDGADNCAQQDCKDAVCNDDYTCGFDPDPTCCFNDLGCSNYPCETCTIDEATGKGSCEKSDYATDLEAEGKQCCMQATGNAAAWGCEESPDDPCTVEACLGNVCRYGPTFFGCCSEAADCQDATKLNVCNAGTGSCVLDGGTGTCSYAADSTHADCCFSNIDCIRSLIEKKVVGYDVATTCLGDGDCGGDYTICHGVLGATAGKCSHHCVTDYDCANFDADFPTCLIADGDTEGVCGKSYPKYLAHCGGDGNGDDSAYQVDPDVTPLSGDEWEKCEFVENPLTCQVPDGVSQVVINELMITPQLAATEAAGQWIELFNPGSSVIDIYGWIIDDSNNPADPAAGNAIEPVQVSTTACNTNDDCPDERYPTCNIDAGAPGICEGPAPAVILPGRMFVICRSDSDTATNGGVDCDYTMANGALWSLDTVGDTVTLWAPDGNGDAVDPPIDTVTYTNAKLTNGQGYSLSLSHPYTSNATDTHWFSYTPNARLSYNGTDFGTPGQINSDVFEKTLIDDDLPGTYIDVCDDTKDCTIGICNLNAPEFCGQVTLEGCCTDTGVAGSAQCSDGNVCTTDTCSQATFMCDNSIPLEDCCNTNAECSDWYPDNFDREVDLVEPIGNITAADYTAVNASFDEVVDKKCIANTCRFRKKPATAAGCVSSDYSNSLFACDDNNPCTLNQCLCSTGDPADCRNGDYTDGYYACDYTDPVEVGDTCCYDDTDCDDLDPTTLDVCVEHLDGVEHFECSNDPDPNYCVTEATCEDNNPCTDDTCSGENRCVFTANTTKVEAGCCIVNNACIDHEILTEGLNKPFTIDVCCVAGDGSDGSGDAVGDNPALDALCDDASVGVEYSQCIHATGDDFCETAADCLTQQPVGKKCLTSYCIANRCRFGTPLLDAGDLGPDFPVGSKCCEDNADCNDANECTTETCVAIAGLDVGYCDIQIDAAKPECCQTTPDCCDPSPGCDPVTEDCCTEDCVKTSCSFDNTKGYRYCKEHDLLGLGLCCTENGDCDDLNSCTLDTCVGSLCRHTTPVAGCCENVGMCPVTGDQCATRACDVPLGGDNDTCALAAVPNCVATMPYIQDFEFAKSFYNSYDDIDVLNWVGSGDNADKWIPSTDATDGLGSDKHLRLWDSTGALDLTNGSCVRLPRINTTGNDAAVITWWHELNLDAAQSAAVTLRVKARKDTNDVYEDIWSQIGVEETMDFYAAIPEADLLSGTTELQFCIESTELTQNSYWAIDDVKVVRGRIPILLTTLTDKVVGAGNDLLIQDIEAYDQDYDTVVFSLVGAPGFVTLDNFHLTPVGPINHAFVDIQVTDAVCNEELNNVYEIKLKVSDGYLSVYETFNLSITGCIQ